MIKGIGIDILYIDSISRWIERYNAETLSLVFTVKEIEACRCGAHPDECFAACFAGKEAVIKALGTGLEGIDWNEIEIEARDGRLTVVLYGAARLRSLAYGITKWSASSTCSGGHMIVSVIAED